MTENLLPEGLQKEISKEIRQMKVSLEDKLDEGFPKIEEEGPAKIANKRGPALVLFSWAITLAEHALTSLAEKANEMGAKKAEKDAEEIAPEFAHEIRQETIKAERDRLRKEVEVKHQKYRDGGHQYCDAYKNHAAGCCFCLGYCEDEVRADNKTDGYNQAIDDVLKILSPEKEPEK